MMSNADLKIFVNYIKSFYGVGGLYGMNIPDYILKEAAAIYRGPKGKKYRNGVAFIGDSLDREKVLMLIEAEYPGYGRV